MAPFSPSERRPYELLLHNVAGAFVGHARSPRPHFLVKSLAFPPIRVEAGKVHGEFGRTAMRFADAVASAQKPLACCRTGVVEFSLFLVRAVIKQLALGLPP